MLRSGYPLSALQCAFCALAFALHFVLLLLGWEILLELRSQSRLIRSFSELPYLLMDLPGECVVVKLRSNIYFCLSFFQNWCCLQWKLKWVCVDSLIAHKIFFFPLSVLHFYGVVWEMYDWFIIWHVGLKFWHGYLELLKLRRGMVNSFWVRILKKTSS